MKINQRQMLLISLLVIIVAGISWYIFIYNAQNREIAGLNAKINQLNSQLVQTTNTSAKLPKVREQIIMMETEYETLSRELFSKDQIEKMTSEISQVCREHNLYVETIQPELSVLLESKKNFIKVPIKISTIGSFFQLGHFIEGVEKLSFQLYITEIEIEKTATPVDLRINMDSYIYVVNKYSRG